MLITELSADHGKLLLASADDGTYAGSADDGMLFKRHQHLKNKVSRTARGFPQNHMFPARCLAKTGKQIRLKEFHFHFQYTVDEIFSRTHCARFRSIKQVYVRMCAYIYIICICTDVYMSNNIDTGMFYITVAIVPNVLSQRSGTEAGVDLA